MLIRIDLVAGEPERQITVSTTVEVNPTLGDSRWQALLVDSITGQAHEGARRLRDEIIAQRALPSGGFVPLAAVVPAVDTTR
jgi:hypothetical protein